MSPAAALSATRSAPCRPGIFAALLVALVLSPASRASDPQSPPPITLHITPAATGLQLVRTPVALPIGALTTNQTLQIPGQKQPVATRILSWHPTPSHVPPSARCVLVTFPWQFKDRTPIHLTFIPTEISPSRPPSLPVQLQIQNNVFQLKWRNGRSVEARLLAPPRISTEPPEIEIIEENAHYQWLRVHLPDPTWPRLVEFRCDSLGGATLLAHLKKNHSENSFAPDFGWELTSKARRADLQTNGTSISARPKNALKSIAFAHSFSNGEPARLLLDTSFIISHPIAPLRKRGDINLEISPGQPARYQFFRCRARESAPMQPMSWLRAEMVFSPSSVAPPTPALLTPHLIEHPTHASATLFPYTPPPTPAQLAPFSALLQYHRQAIARSLAIGDDLGNVTSFSDAAPHGGNFGMNRLNHAPPIFEDAWRTSSPLLAETALLWCENFYDQSIWWGDNDRGGTRYNNVVAMNRTPPTPHYMWRSDSSVHFCTKGYDTFWFAWELTGDPRFKEALHAQIEYASRAIHAHQGECRNIGDVRDFIRLHRIVGDPHYLNESLRLFRELRTKLSPDHLFDQGGKPIDPDPPFFDDDQRGLKTGYAKPYIIGYALAGLPELLAFAPEEPRLRETIQAVADFLARTVDPAGGWRYPHPNSSAVIISQGLEHAWQLTQAARALGPNKNWLDAIETVLRARILAWEKTGQILSGLEGWEVSTGKVASRDALHALYAKPADRNPSQDYSQGRFSLGYAPPEGLVYLPDVLAYYLSQRPADRLLAPPAPGSPLDQLLQRLPDKRR